VRRIRKLALPVLLVEPLLSTYALHHTLLSDADRATAVGLLGDSIERQFGGWAILQLNRLVEGDVTAQAWLAWARQRRCLTEAVHGSRPPYLSIETDWDAYLRAQSRKFRSNLSRERRNLERAGKVSVDCIVTQDRMAEALAALMHVETSSWKTGDRTSLVSRPWEARFYSQLAQEYAASGQAVLSILSLDAVPIAFDLMLTGGGKAYGLKSSFDDRYRKLAPGSVLEAAVMQWVFEAGFKEYDFLGTDEPYKLQWTDTVRQDLSLTIVNRDSLIGALYATAKRALAWLAG
jgi:CelD/BcsL family acetyltransferase involved in cellulose biosynthesis